MSLRFRRSIKVAPGLKLNIGKGSVGLSAGVKGAHVGMNSKGRKFASAGIPGTGLSVTKSWSNKKGSRTGTDASGYVQGQAKPKSAIPLYIIGGFLALVGLGCLPTNIISGIIALALGVYIITVGRKRAKAAQAPPEEKAETE